MAFLPFSPLAWAEKPPRPGQGLHPDLYRAACTLIEAGFPPEKVAPLIAHACAGLVDRPPPPREIESAVAYATRAVASGSPNVTVPWPEFNAALRAEAIATMKVDLRQLEADFPVRDPKTYLDNLFLPHELVCIGRSSYSFFTKPAADWTTEELAAAELITPSAMSDVWGMTKDNKPSMHTLSNTGRKTRQVVEFDTGTIEEHAACLRWLSRRMPMILLVYSGGKSLHGWFDVRHCDEAEVREFFGLAVSLGADRRMFSPVQFARLPGGKNSNTGRLQRVLFERPTR